MSLVQVFQNFRIPPCRKFTWETFSTERELCQLWHNTFYYNFSLNRFRFESLKGFKETTVIFGIAIKRQDIYILKQIVVSEWVFDLHK